MWIVYLIQHTKTKELYIGVTNNLKKRLERHNQKGKRFTRRKDGKWVVIYAEAYRSKEDAIERERKLKHHGSAKHELYKRIQRSFLPTSLSTEAGKNAKTGAG